MRQGIHFFGIGDGFGPQVVGTGIIHDIQKGHIDPPHRARHQSSYHHFQVIDKTMITSNS